MGPGLEVGLMIHISMSKCQANPHPRNTFSGIANMMNGEFQGKYVQFNIVPSSGKTDQEIVGVTLAHEIAPCYVMSTPQETGLTAPLNERHIPLYAQEPSPLSRQGCAQQAYTSHVTTYQYQNSNVIPNQEYLQPHITSTPGQIPYLHQVQQQCLPNNQKTVHRMMW